jgi:pyrroloquinoline quinone biosynthesis protein B
MKLRILGSTAGGGLPQWNCGGANSVRARAGDAAVPARSQTCVAVSADGRRWSLLWASPDLRSQLNAFPPLHPRPGTRDVQLDSVVLTSAELDCVLGLLLLRESLSYRVLSTRWVREALLDHGAPFRPLEASWGGAALDQPVYLDRGELLEARFFPVAPKLPSYLRELAASNRETTVGLRLTDMRSGRRVVFVPGMKALDAALLAELQAADLRLVDGTFYSWDELLALRPGAPDAVAMGHLPISGAGGSLERLAGLRGRTLYIHMNATNPILDASSKARAEVLRAGVEIAGDGQELEL